ncbi:MAG TPA: MlaD family protein [Aeromicrobium sp.]|nr:MlaD family protein [Aeromicrobium sp.]
MRRASMFKTVVVGAVTIVLIALLWRTFAPGGTGYAAEFTHASGVRVGDEVRIAGIESGKVTDISLKQGTAVVSFEIDGDVKIPQDTQARVKLASMLGTTYLELTPGQGPPLEAGDHITTAHTAPSYTVSNVFTDSNDILHDLDLDALDRAISTLSTEFDQDPELTQRTIESTAELARLIGQKDAQIDRLLGYTRDVTGIVRAQQTELDNLLVNAEQVATLVQRRRATIERLVQNGKQVLQTLDGMADRNDATMRKLLGQFDQTLTILQDHSDDLARTLQRAAPFARYYANATGNGPWLEVGAPYFLLPDDLWCPIVQPPGGCS